MDIRLLLIEDEKDQALMIKALLDLSPRNFINVVYILKVPN